jgi:hypothetical protein
MGRGRKLKATFSDGKVDHLTTEKGFTHAWRITGLKGAQLVGWVEPKAKPIEPADDGFRCRSTHPTG